MKTKQILRSTLLVSIGLIVPTQLAGAQTTSASQNAVSSSGPSVASSNSSHSVQPSAQSNTLICQVFSMQVTLFGGVMLKVVPGSKPKAL